MKPLLFLTLILLAAGVCAQNVSKELLSINAQVDEAVVSKNTSVLKKYYANDFVFTHGTGLVEGKES